MDYQLTSLEIKLMNLLKESGMEMFFAMAVMFLLNGNEGKQAEIVEVLEEAVKTPPESEEEKKMLMIKIGEIVDRMEE